MTGILFKLDVDEVGMGTVIMSAMALDSDNLLNLVTRAYNGLSLTLLISLGFVIMGKQQ